MVEKDATTSMLLDHAAGTLPGTLDVMIASYVDMNPEASQSFAALQAVGGVLLEDMDDGSTAPISSDALDLILDKLDDDDIAADGVSDYPEPAFDARTRSVIPAPLRRLLPASLDNLKWRSRGAGVRECRLENGDTGLNASLYWIAPGKTIPMHTHKGREYTLILEGAYRDEDGKVTAGDFVVNDGEHAHRPVADPELGCLCFAVTDAPLKFHGPLGWVINPFLRN